MAASLTATRWPHHDGGTAPPAATAPTAWWIAPRRNLVLASGLSGGIWLMFTLGAWGTLGQSSPDFWLFAGHLLLGWFLSIFVQLCTLQGLRAWRPGGLVWMLARLGLILLIGAIFNHGPLSSQAHSARLGLTVPDPAWFNLPVWLSLWMSVFLIVRDEGVRRQAAALQRLQQLQAAQIGRRRRMVETQLSALQARVDPQLFFDLLDAVERHYACDEARAEALLDEVIVFLRAALPRLNSPSSCLAQELALVQSYARARRLAADDFPVLVADIAADIQDLAFPAGVLLPLLSGIATALPAGGRLELTATVSASSGAAGTHHGTLTLMLEAPAAIALPLLDGIRQTLRALHDDADAWCMSGVDGRFHHGLSVPLETA